MCRQSYPVNRRRERRYKRQVLAVLGLLNDAADYPEDSYENMQRIATEMAFPFPYLLDETQEIAKKYDAVCTPDFFGYNSNLELQYRGRLDESGIKPAPAGARRDLVAMNWLPAPEKGQKIKLPVRFSIKWR